MTNKSPSIHIDIPTAPQPTEYRAGIIKWCDMHWADLMFALKDRGLEEFIAEDDETLTLKLASGEGDACWEAFNSVNVGAMTIFGATKIIDEHNGCPACAFAKIAEHAADLVTAKFKEPH